MSIESIQKLPNEYTFHKYVVSNGRRGQGDEITPRDLHESATDPEVSSRVTFEGLQGEAFKEYAKLAEKVSDKTSLKAYNDGIAEGKKGAEKIAEKQIPWHWVLQSASFGATLGAMATYAIMRNKNKQSHNQATY